MMACIFPRLKLSENLQLFNSSEIGFEAFHELFLHRQQLRQSCIFSPVLRLTWKEISRSSLEQVHFCVMQSTMIRRSHFHLYKQFYIRFFFPDFFYSA